MGSCRNAQSSTRQWKRRISSMEHNRTDAHTATDVVDTVHSAHAFTVRCTGAADGRGWHSRWRSQNRKEHNGENKRQCVAAKERDAQHRKERRTAAAGCHRNRSGRSGATSQPRGAPAARRRASSAHAARRSTHSHGRHLLAAAARDPHAASRPHAATRQPPLRGNTRGHESRVRTRPKAHGDVGFEFPVVWNPHTR